MKHFLFLIFLFSANFSFAQNYELVKPNHVNYFLDTDNFIHAFKVDSSSFNGSDTVYNSFKRVRDFGCGIELEAPIFGKKIIKKSSGLYQILNANLDTIVINSYSSIGDNWVCYHALNNQYIEAECVNVSFENVSGIMDSVKTIGFTLKNSLNIVLSSPINNLILKISKNYGLISTVDFALFPFVEVGANKLNFNAFEEQNAYNQLEIESINSFSFQRPDYHKSYYFDYEIGDIIQDKYIEKQGLYYISTTIIESSVYDKIIYTDSIVYLVNQKMSRERKNEMNSDYFFTEGSAKWTIDLNEKLVTGMYYEIDSLKQNSFSFVNDSTRSRLTKHRLSFIPNVGPGDLSPCSVDRNDYLYFEGIGGPYYNIYTGTPDYPNASESKSLIYYKKGNVEWGTYVPVSIKNVENESNLITVFPNPNTGTFNINFEEFKDVYKLEVFNLMGEKVLQEKVVSKNKLVKTKFSKGVYILKIIKENKVFTKRIIIN